VGKWVEVNFGYKNPRLVYSLLRDLKIIGNPFRGIVKFVRNIKKCFDY
jgi:hypothetical protein